MVALIAVVALALLFDFTNGFHDAANSVSTVVATRVLPAKWAVWFSAFFNFAAVFIVGTAVANTVAKTVHADVTGIGVVFAALFAAIAWNYATWWFGMPSVLDFRLLCRWSARAISSLPEPFSPVISTRPSLGAARWINA